MQQGDARIIGFKKDFTYAGKSFIIDVKPFTAATKNEIASHHLHEGDFLVYLFDGTSITSLVFSIGDGLEWKTKSMLLLHDKDLIERIGFLIDDAFA